MSRRPPPNRQSTPRVAFIQDGSRLHYAVPVALAQLGMLEWMYTDWFNRQRWSDRRILSTIELIKPALARRMAQRRSDQLDGVKIVQQRSLVLRSALSWRRFASNTDFYQWVADQTAKRILARGFGDANVLMGFIRNISPQLCRAAGKTGLWRIGDQIIAPAAVEQAEMQLQQQRWPDWEEQTGENYPAIADFEQRTWEQLDHITCASDFVRDGLLAQGVKPEKVTLIPYPVDASQYECVDRRERREPVVVGFTGTICLRKGAPYFLEIAKRFDPEKVRFVMVGGSRLAPSVLDQFRDRVELVGRVSRQEIADWLARFDIFFFPSTCEGSAGSVMEAMASGLPVVTSRNSGTIARDGQEGFIVPYDDLDATSQRIQQLIDDPSLRHQMGLAGRQRVEACGPASYASELDRVLTQLVPEE